jgi:hypothetical protein
MITATINSIGITLQLGELTDRLSKEHLEALGSDLKTPSLNLSLSFPPSSKAVMTIFYTVPVEEAVRILKKYGIETSVVPDEQT